MREAVALAALMLGVLPSGVSLILYLLGCFNAELLVPGIAPMRLSPAY